MAENFGVLRKKRRFYFQVESRMARMKRHYLRLTVAAATALASLTVIAPASHAQSSLPMPGIGSYSMNAIQLYSYHKMVPFNEEGTPYRKMANCASRWTSTLGIYSMEADYIAAAGCVLTNPFLNAALDAQMRAVAGH